MFTPRNVVIANKSLWDGLTKWLGNNGLELLPIQMAEDELPVYLVGIKKSPDH